MFKKSFLVLVPVLAAAGPVAVFSAPGWWSRISASIAPSTSTEAEDGLTGIFSGFRDGTGDSTTGEADDSPESIPLYGPADVFRFDLSPDWVVNHWPRVSAGLAYLELQGYRVPLVTGTAEDDLAGALTYYFNPRQQLQRITFRGTTGNATGLVALVTSRFGLVRRLTNDASVFVYEIPGPHGKATSFLWVRPAPVVKESDPHRRFEVALVIERPDQR